MSDQESGPPDHQAGQRLLNRALALGVEGAGRLIKDQDLWILE